MSQQLFNLDSDLWDLAEEFLKMLPNKNTRRAYRGCLIKYVGWLVDSGHVAPTPREMNVSNVVSYRASLSGYANATITLHIKAIRRFAGFCAEATGTINPLKNLIIPKIQFRPLSPVSSEIRNVLMHVATHKFTNYRDSRIAISILFCLGLGLRPVSALDIRWNQISLSRGVIKEVLLKGGHYQDKVLTDKFTDSLRWHLAISEKELGIHLQSFPYPVLASQFGAHWADFDSYKWHDSSLRRTLRAFSSECGEAINARKLRHTFSHNFLDNGGDAYRLAWELGHTSPVTAMHYTNQTTEEKRELLEKVWRDVG